MENFRTCPVCFEVPESEIFQCFAGHVICYSCFSKVNSGLCPQCRKPFGTLKIRNRALEEILDAQDFECKFKDQGCSHSCKREELITHENSCQHNPDTVPLCQQIGLDCGFRLGCRSKAEVILHFQNKHNIRTAKTPGLCMKQRWEHAWTFSTRNVEIFTMTNNETKRKFSASSIPTVYWGLIVGSDYIDTTSPLFLIQAKLNRLIMCWSFRCIKIWDSATPFAVKYNANFTFNRDLSSNPSQGPSSSGTSRMNENYPFPFSGTMTVCNIKEALQLSEASPINIPILLLEETGFGCSSLDNMLVKITRL